mmetsp:Transcript_9642/g.28994  ORF Transcript_9642/g.28994 Transcript_9642/m.28994 type:complete len:319 (-) Transcript_9642:1077-2033(-)
MPLLDAPEDAPPGLVEVLCNLLQDDALRECDALRRLLDLLLQHLLALGEAPAEGVRRVQGVGRGAAPDLGEGRLPLLDHVLRPPGSLHGELLALLPEVVGLVGGGLRRLDRGLPGGLGLLAQRQGPLVGDEVGVLRGDDDGPARGPRPVPRRGEGLFGDLLRLPLLGVDALDHLLRVLLQRVVHRQHCPPRFLGRLVALRLRRQGSELRRKLAGLLLLLGHPGGLSCGSERTFGGALHCGGRRPGRLLGGLRRFAELVVRRPGSCLRRLAGAVERVFQGSARGHRRLVRLRRLLVRGSAHVVDRVHRLIVGLLRQCLG